MRRITSCVTRTRPSARRSTCHRRDRRGGGVPAPAAGREAQEAHRSEGGRGRHRQDGPHPGQVGVEVGYGIPARAGDRSEADGLWSGTGHRSGVVGDEAGAGGSARPEQAHRVLPVHRSDRRRQDRSRQAARRHPGHRNAALRHVRVHGAPHGQPPDRCASGLCRLRPGRPVDRAVDQHPHCKRHPDHDDQRGRRRQCARGHRLRPGQGRGRGRKGHPAPVRPRVPQPSGRHRGLQAAGRRDDPLGGHQVRAAAGSPAGGPQHHHRTGRRGGRLAGQERLRRTGLRDLDASQPLIRHASRAAFARKRRGPCLTATAQSAQEHRRAGDDAGGQQRFAAGEVQTLAGRVAQVDGGLVDHAVEAVDDAAIGVERLALDLVQLAFDLELAVARHATEAVLGLALHKFRRNSRCDALSAGAIGRQSRRHRVHLGLDRRALVVEVAGDRIAQRRIGDEMGGIDGRGQVAARDLVLSLRPRLDTRQAARDGEVDCLIIAKLEMEEGPVDQRPPLASVKRVPSDEIQRPGYRRLSFKRHHQGDAVSHGRADAGEEVARQIGPPPFSVARVHVEGEEGLPMRLGDLGARQHADVEAGLRLASLAPDGLASIGRQGGQEIVEALIAVVAPDELDVAARQQARRGHGAPFGL
uniref:LigA n=1 Tax=Parastrongyloides trichosuri TaxID=131310 RepID=A0A0N5A785_PARTI